MFECELDVFVFGSFIGKFDGLSSYNLRLKNACHHCGVHAIVIVKNRVIKAFSTRAKPSVYEHPFGAYSFDTDEVNDENT